MPLEVEWSCDLRLVPSRRDVCSLAGRCLVVGCFGGNSLRLQLAKDHMLKILVLVDHARGVSGPHRNVVGSLNALAARGDVEVRLLCREIDPNEPYARGSRIDIRLGYDPHDAKRLPSNMLRVLSAARGCNVIYVPSGAKSLLYAQVARFGRQLVVGPNMTPPLFLIRKQDPPHRIELKILCDRWIEPSYERTAYFIRCTGNPEIETVHHAIDSQKWGPGRRDQSLWARFGVPNQGVKILCVSADDRARKGIDQLLDGYTMLKQCTSIPTCLVLAGRRSESTKQRLARIDSAYDLGFVGPDLLPALYASADICVIPSSWESFGFTVLESLASAVATLSSETGGIREQIIDGISGRLVKITDDEISFRPDAPERLANAMLELVIDTDLRDRLAAGGRERALKHFSEERLGADLVSLFQRTLANAGGKSF